VQCVVQGPPAHLASPEQIVELRDQGLTWNETAEQVDMSVSGAWQPLSADPPPNPPRLGRWQQVLADALDQNLAIGVGQLSLIILAEPRPVLSSPLPASRPRPRRLGLCPPAARAGCGSGRQYKRSDLPGAGEAECDHE
jgi:hypothetical protein